MPKKIINEKTFPTLALINFIFALFVDSMFVFKHFKYSSAETLVYLVIFNLSFILFTVVSIADVKKKGKKRQRKSLSEIITEYYPITILAVIVTVLAISCFDTTAVYDGHLYYGSFLQSLVAFEMTAKSAIGAFIQWGHNFAGSAVILAPFEILKYGDMVGSYFANTLLFVITLYILYVYMRDMFKGLDKWVITLMVAVFAFMPYAFSLITYFCPDFYLQLYIIWLLYAYKKDNQLMVSFIGFLICFTKDSGAFIYGFLVLFLYLVDVNTRYGYKRLEWLKLKNLPIARFVLWLIPAILYGVNFILKGQLQAQEFEGAENLSFGLNAADFSIQALISFVYGFRWVIVLLFAIAVIILITNRKNISDLGITKLDIDYRNIFIALALGTLMLHLMFSVFTLSHCPRYTAPMNVLMIFMLAYSISVIFASKKTKQIIASFIMSLLMLVQTYVTIDPAIKTLCAGIDTGDNVVYDLGVKRNIYAGFFSETVGDYYVYNREYTVATQLTQDALKALDFKSDVCIYVYDDYYCYYEHHISGLQYPLYWDTARKKQTYSQNKNTIYVNSCVLDDEVMSGDLGEYVIVFVPARVDYSALTDKMSEHGYNEESSFIVGNLYGRMTVVTYHMV